MLLHPSRAHFPTVADSGGNPGAERAPSGRKKRRAQSDRCREEGSFLWRGAEPPAVSVPSQGSGRKDF
ncbi:hypothetical protein MATL_G00199180 [Megalops atlanticus]|uniref:Uncharacterized protein n=1 Tax=Megalops atlanticus TaxID=7932 RepID=A0A9D3T593_MEGAT|nr:hypothetical protein MATL_G00199180 [Megalops atlanticus]